MMNNKLITEIKELRGRGNFQTIKKKIGKKRLKEFFETIYPKFSITEIENITKIPTSTIEYWFIKLNIPFSRNHITNLSIPANFDNKIVIKERNKTKRVTAIEITPELAYIIGFALGDGCIQKYAVEVFNQDINLKNYLFKLLQPYGTIGISERDDGLWRLRLSSIKIANLIKDGKKIRKDTLKYIFQNDDLARQFIAAFWDAEGSVLSTKYNYYHIYLYNSDDYILNKISEFLKSKDIKFSKLIMKARTEKYFLKGREIKPKKTIKRISIPKSSCLKWVKEIGIHLNHKKKSEIVKNILRLYGGKQNE